MDSWLREKDVDDEEVKVTNGYKYLWMTLPTKRCINFVLSQVCKKGEKEIQKALRRLSSSDSYAF